MGARSALRALALAALAVVACGAPAEGPAPVAWNRQDCARCRMLVGEPRFAAQLHTADGAVLHFDDPGCLLLHRAESPGLEVRATWYHHVREDRWVRGEHAAFVPVGEPTPMGYGLGAVEAGEVPQGLDAEAALAAVRRRESERGRHAP